MRSRISIRGYVRPLVRPSICQSVGPSVTQKFLTKLLSHQYERERILCRVSGLVLFEIAKTRVSTSVGKRKAREEGEDGMGRGGGVEGGGGVWKEVKSP